MTYPTRDDFIHIQQGEHWFIEPGASGMVLTVRQSERTDGFEAEALWPAENRRLTCCGPTIEKAQDGLLEAIASPPPPGQAYFFFANESAR